METALALTVIVGATELVKRLFDRDWRAAVLILVAAAVGAICGALGVQGLHGVIAGIAFGLGASGFVTVAQHVAKKA